MNSIVKNRYLDALLKLMLLSAILHMVVLGVYFLVYNDISYFNFFTIIALDLFFPVLSYTENTFMYSLITMVGLYFSLFYFFTKKK